MFWIRGGQGTKRFYCNTRAGRNIERSRRLAIWTWSTQNSGGGYLLSTLPRFIAFQRGVYSICHLRPNLHIPVRDFFGSVECKIKHLRMQNFLIEGLVMSDGLLRKVCTKWLLSTCGTPWINSRGLGILGPCKR